MTVTLSPYSGQAPHMVNREQHYSACIAFKSALWPCQSFLLVHSFATLCNNLHLVCLSGGTSVKGCRHNAKHRDQMRPYLQLKQLTDAHRSADAEHALCFLALLWG